MNKIIASAVIGVSLFSATIASAQSYYAGYATSYSTSACVNLTNDLSVGSRGSQVSSLQSFLVSQNYPGGGSWMITGYYGQATAAALRIFQQQRGLIATGVADAMTRAAINQMSCGQGGGSFSIYNSSYTPMYPYGYDIYSYNQMYPFGYQYQNAYPYQYNTYPYNTYNNSCGTYPFYYQCQQNPTYPTYQTGPYSISLSPNSGAVGSTVTVYGSNFSSSGNTVQFGNGIIANLSSFDGRTLSFTVPSQLSGYGYQPIGLGTYNVSVRNAQGVSSNTAPFTITSLGSYSNVQITSVNGPTSLSVNQMGTWSVNVSSQSGTQLSVSARWGDENLYGAGMAAPQSMYSNGSNTATFSHTYLTAGTYTVVFTVSNQYGQQNTSSITVNVGGSSNNSITLSSLSPTSGSVGSVILLTGSGFTGDNTIHFGIGGKKNVISASNTYLYFTIPSQLSPCDVVPNGQYCATYFQSVTPGTYPVYVTNSNGTSQTLYFQVY